MGPSNIVLRPQFSQFQYPTDAFEFDFTVGSAVQGTRIILTPQTSPFLLEVPEVTPGIYATLDLNAYYSYLLTNSVAGAGPSQIPAHVLRHEVYYTIDGVAQSSFITEKILIEKGSVRNINITTLAAIMAMDLANLQTTSLMVPGAVGDSALALIHVSPVLTLWY